jgi:hypothetical protein
VEAVDDRRTMTDGKRAVDRIVPLPGRIVALAELYRTIGRSH